MIVHPRKVVPSFILKDTLSPIDTVRPLIFLLFSMARAFLVNGAEAFPREGSNPHFLIQSQTSCLLDDRGSHGFRRDRALSGTRTLDPPVKSRLLWTN